MSYQKEKDARVERVARLVEDYLCRLVEEASDETWWELYQAAYDFDGYSKRVMAVGFILLGDKRLD